jgi:hypothetical protein
MTQVEPLRLPMQSALSWQEPMQLSIALRWMVSQELSPGWQQSDLEGYGELTRQSLSSRHCTQLPAAQKSPPGWSRVLQS